MRQIEHKRNATTWFALMLDRAVAFVPTATPMLLVMIDWLLGQLTGSGSFVREHPSSVVVALFIGRFLREGLASGKIVKDLNATRAQYQTFLDSSHNAVPVGPYAPGAGIPWEPPVVHSAPPPGVQVPRGY